MPITIKRGLVRYKDHNGNYKDIAAVGQDGSNAYVYIRYSAAEPTSDADMKTTPDAWIGFYAGHDPQAPAHYTDYEWYKIRGEQGTAGHGVPQGGAANRVLAKASASDYDVEWVDIGEIPGVSGKADKVSSATSGNFAALDGNGNLTDSGAKPADYFTKQGSAQLVYKSIDDVADINLWSIAQIKNGRKITDSGNETSLSSSSCTDLIPAKSGEYFFNATKNSQIVYYVDFHAYIDGVWHRKIGSTAVQNNMSKTFSLQEGENGIRVSFVTDTFVNPVLYASSGISAKDTFARTAKADKVSGATAGNLAGLDANGNLVDSGKKPADFYSKPQTGIPASDLASGVIPTVHNVPAGGSASQVLAKASGADYDLTWVNQSGGLPAVTSSDNGKVLRVVNGVWSAAGLPSASGVSF